MGQTTTTKTRPNMKGIIIIMLIIMLLVFHHCMLLSIMAVLMLPTVHRLLFFGAAHSVLLNVAAIEQLQSQCPVDRQVVVAHIHR